MSASVKLRIYNAALGHVGERKLSSLTEGRESRRVLDDYYDTVKSYCLEQGMWDFAAVFGELNKSASVTPGFGFTNAFVKPTAMLRIIKLSDSPNFEPPLERFSETGKYWYADCDPLYVHYVSSASTAGGEEANWTSAFEEYVTLRLAAQICTRISGAETRQAMLEKKERKALAVARNLNHAADAPIYQAPGSWVMSRFGGSNRSRWDRRS